ncbi:DUF885 domain-containing protein [Lentzea sp. BCCO 10_0856]|uniref:DUF885 domain-containing protein n=1 Tax=Lentzea miocenica TaxID=3095431 RepID=A0ABU4T885_9PSEU|nr:DUF885 domain-containing protein [Lentzea sp. BCCO 10_0856]MDX8034148.1 DUF885 domain-containing protein [Lentzea sp. BCCO 10_0856]
MIEPEVRDYLLLGLRIGRHVEGYVDCWFGDAEVARRAETEPLPAPAQLAADAEDITRRVADSDLGPARQRFLLAQLTAMRCTSRLLAGESTAFLDEVQAYFGVEIAPGDTDSYAQAHGEIAELLPGKGDLRGRLELFHEQNTIPAARLRAAVQAVSDELRPIVRSTYGLPEREHVQYEVVRDKPWNAFNRYHGDFRSTVTLNAEAGRNLAALPLLATHESYPGHHAEHCLKEAVLVRERGQAEHTISLVNTPQCLLAEGAAERALWASLGNGWGGWTERALAEQGVRIDGELLERVLRPWSLLLPVRQDAAIMLHDRGADPEDVAEYIGRWLLLPEERARQMLRFLTDPLWRAYTVSYIEGARLVSRWLGPHDDGEVVTGRFRRLLTEPLLPSELAIP